MVVPIPSQENGGSLALALMTSTARASSPQAVLLAAPLAEPPPAPAGKDQQRVTRARLQAAVLVMARSPHLVAR